MPEAVKTDNLWSGMALKLTLTLIRASRYSTYKQVLPLIPAAMVGSAALPADHMISLRKATKTITLGVRFATCEFWETQSFRP